MAFGSAWGFDGVAYDGKEMRELVETLTGGLSGVTGPATSLAVSQQTSADATVKVAEGGAVIPATAAGQGGSYQVYNDADLTSPAFDPTSANGRKDRLILRVTSGVPALEIVQGTASGSPVEPSITGDNFLELAMVTLPASTTNITNAMITDRRVRLTAGAPVVCTSTTQPAAPYEGLVIYETDTDRLKVFNGTAWRTFGTTQVVISGSFADSVASGSAGDDNVAVSFGVTFAAAPVVVATIRNGTNLDILLNIETISTTGFNFRAVYRDAGGTFASSASYNVEWVAHGALA